MFQPQRVTCTSGFSKAAMIGSIVGGVIGGIILGAASGILFYRVRDARGIVIRPNN
jgi:uncharacterized protein YqgC (DUF456 family)